MYATFRTEKMFTEMTQANRNDGLVLCSWPLRTTPPWWKRPREKANFNMEEAKKIKLKIIESAPQL